MAVASREILGRQEQGEKQQGQKPDLYVDALKSTYKDYVQLAAQYGRDQEGLNRARAEKGDQNRTARQPELAALGANFETGLFVEQDGLAEPAPRITTESGLQEKTYGVLLDEGPRLNTDDVARDNQLGGPVQAAYLVKQLFVPLGIEVYGGENNDTRLAAVGLRYDRADTANPRVVEIAYKDEQGVLVQERIVNNPGQTPKKLRLENGAYIPVAEQVGPYATELKKLKEKVAEIDAVSKLGEVSAAEYSALKRGDKAAYEQIAQKLSKRVDEVLANLDKQLETQLSVIDAQISALPGGYFKKAKVTEAKTQLAAVRAEVEAMRTNLPGELALIKNEFAQALKARTTNFDKFQNFISTSPDAKLSNLLITTTLESDLKTERDKIVDALTEKQQKVGTVIQSI